MGETSNNLIAYTVKIPKKVLEEMQLRVPQGARIDFIREALVDKLQEIPRPDRFLEIEKRISKVEEELAHIRKTLADLEILSYEKGKVDPYSFCKDEIDRRIVEFLIQKAGALTSEISQALGKNRWLILNRLKKIQERSEKKLGKPIVYFLAVEKAGKKRSWWFNSELAG